MWFGLEDIKNNTILGTPIEELQPYIDKILSELQNQRSD